MCHRHISTFLPSSIQLYFQWDIFIISVYRKEYSPLCSDFTERSDVLSQERAVFFYTSNMQLYSGPIIKCKGPYRLFTKFHPNFSPLH